MSTALPRGTLTISIDLEPATAREISAQGALDQVASRLLALFSRHEMAATWCVADPAVSAARGRIATFAEHELAILGDAAWVGREAGRGRFAHELNRRVSRARGAGLPIETLALRTPLPIDHCDLVVKEGIIAARLASTPDLADSPRRHQGQTLRFGLWGFPVGIALPGTSRWLPGGGGTRRARFAIDEAISQRGLVHLAVDAAALAARGMSAERVLERVVDHVVRRRLHGLLTVATLGALARELSQAHCGQPSRSILRPAA
jgi:hypothetical protein